MPKFNEQLKMLRREAGISQQEFANRIGISKSSVNMYERGEREPGLETLETIADYFHVDMDFLLGKSEHRNKFAWLNDLDDSKESFTLPQNIMPIPKMKKVPLIGTIACGTPILAVEDATEFINAPETMDIDFALECKGDSMINAGIHENDIIVVKQQNTAENGEIVIALIDDSATVKRLFRKDNKIILHPENDNMSDMIFDNVIILGVVKGLFRKF